MKEYNNKSLKKLSEIQQHLATALRTANNEFANDNSVAEARGHIREAMRNIDKISKKQTRQRTRTPQDEWNETLSTVAHQPMAKHTAQAVMKNLDDLIKEKETYIEDLQRKRNEKPQQDDDIDFNNIDILND